MQESLEVVLSLMARQAYETLGQVAEPSCTQMEALGETFQGVCEGESDGLAVWQWCDRGCVRGGRGEGERDCDLFDVGQNLMSPY